MLVLGAFSTGVFQIPMHYPTLTLVPTSGVNQSSGQVFINVGTCLHFTSDAQGLCGVLPTRLGCLEALALMV